MLKECKDLQANIQQLIGMLEQLKQQSPIQIKDYFEKKPDERKSENIFK